MVSFLGKLFLSLLVTNWVYSETIIFFPELERVCVDIAQTFRIPTHPEWPAIAQSPEAKRLRRDLESGPRVSEQEWFVALADQWERASSGELFRLLTFDRTESRRQRFVSADSISRHDYKATSFIPAPSLMNDLQGELGYF